MTFGEDVVAGRRHDARGRGRRADRGRGRRDRRQLRRRAARVPRRAGPRWRARATATRRARSCPTPACPSASTAGSSTRPSRPGSARSCRGCSTPGRGSSAAAAARRPAHIAAMRAALDAPPDRGRGGPRRQAASRAPSPSTGRLGRHAADRVRRAPARPASPCPSAARASAMRWPPAGSSSRSRSTRRAASGSSGRSRPRASSRPPAPTSSTCRDSAMARVRMGALAVAFGIQHDLDLECLVHFTTRDRNLMALESELLGAHALGVRNILALTGDPPRIGDYPTGSGVWDVDSIGLIEILARLNRGEDQAGSPIGQQAAFTIACALDPTAADTATEWDRLERKLAAGAHLIMTQPLYDEAQVEAMLAEARRRFGPRGFPVPVLLGVLPLVSARHAEFLHNEVPGITIPRGHAQPDARRRRGRHRGRHRHGRRAARGRRGRGLRHLPDAELRALRAGRRARAPDPRPPPRSRRRSPPDPDARVSVGHAPAPFPSPALAASRPSPSSWRSPGSPSRPARRSRRRSTARPSTTRPARCAARPSAGRGDDRRDRAADGRRDRRLHPARRRAARTRRRPSTTPGR